MFAPRARVCNRSAGTAQAWVYVSSTRQTATLVVIACLFVSWPLALIVGIALLLYIQVENISIQPIIQTKYSELTPLLVFMAALIGIYAAGLLGAFVAIPLAGCLKVALKAYLANRTPASA